MRPTKRVASEDSISTAIRQMRENGAGLLPVESNEKFVGVLTESRLTQALANGFDLHQAVSDAMVTWPTVAPYNTGAEALRRLSDMELATLVVVDDEKRLLGLLSASDLVPRVRPPIRPNMIGGMASPFGVYLTTGTVSGGVSKWALMATGATMFGLLLVGSVLTLLLTNAISPYAPIWIRSDSFQWFVSFSLFAFGMRLMPMAGIHAAEHQVVHTIERGEELRYDIVARMPRVHPRCGTNLATGIGIFLAIFSVEWIPGQDVRALVGAFTALLLWKRVGALAQFYITTRPPTRKNIESGIRAGEQLLDRYSQAHVVRPSIPRYIWASGLLHVLAGSMACYGVAWVIGWAFHLNWLMN